MPDREKVIGHLNDCMEASRRDNTWVFVRKDIVEDAIVLLKEQDAKTGYWINSAGDNKCSVCGEEYSDLYPDYSNTHFCPNCGAKMKGR